MSSSEMHEKLQNYVIKTFLSQSYLKKPTLLSRERALAHEGELLHRKCARGFAKQVVKEENIW